MFDLHMHSIYSDGENPPEEMIEEGIRLGLSCIGLSDHSHADWDDAGMKTSMIEAYRQKLAGLKTSYTGRIRVLCGLERDYYSDDFRTYDYVIGSVHAVRMPDGVFFCIDWDPKGMEEKVRTYFDGDWYALTEAYFRLEADVVTRTKCDIIGHFDLVSKFNEQHRWFDPCHPRYRKAWQQAADCLLRTGKIFEVNTGAISRGYRTDAYPAKEIRDYLRERGGKLILSSDAHRRENICFRFEQFLSELVPHI